MCDIPRIHSHSIFFEHQLVAIKFVDYLDPEIQTFHSFVGEFDLSSDFGTLVTKLCVFPKFSKILIEDFIFFSSFSHSFGLLEASV